MQRTQRFQKLQFFKRREVFIASLVVIVGVAVYLNWVFSNPDNLTAPESEASVNDESFSTFGETIFTSGVFEEVDESVSAEVSADDDAVNQYFAHAVINRQKTRDEAIEILSGIAENDKYSEEDRSKAAGDLANIAKAIDQEGRIENLIMAKGFEKCLAFISGDNVNVVVRTDGLLPNEVSQIKDIVINEAGVKADKVKIVEVK